MNDTLLIIGYLLVGVVFSRWPIGLYRRGSGYGGWYEPLDVVGMLGLLLLSMLFWPAIAVVAGIYGLYVGITRLPLWPALTKAVTWFYTLDRDERKELLAK